MKCKKLQYQKQLFNSYVTVCRKQEREMFYLTTHSTHFIYGYMASDIWLRTILIVRKETRCRHIGYSYRLTARVLLYAPSHRIKHTTAFVTPVVEHWLEREIAQWVHVENNVDVKQYSILCVLLLFLCLCSSEGGYFDPGMWLMSTRDVRMT